MDNELVKRFFGEDYEKTLTPEGIQELLNEPTTREWTLEELLAE